MSKDNVVDFTGATRLDLDPDKVLTKAIGELQVSVVVGFDKGGKFYFSSSTGKAPDIAWMLDRAKLALLDAASEE
jgi:hypothetical protein